MAERPLDATDIEVVARLRTREGEEIAYPCRFTSDEWALLEEFATEAEALSRTRLLSKRWGNFEVSLTMDGEGLRFHPTSLPDPDDFRACLLLMRPFVLEGERTFFPRIRKILAGRLNHPAFQRYLDRQKEIFEGLRQGMVVMSNGVQVNSATTLDRLWLNGYHYHRDKGKRAKFEALHDGHTLPLEFSDALFQDIMMERTRAVLDVGNAIYSMQRNRVVTPFPGDL
jgi:hypothetical protein